MLTEKAIQWLEARGLDVETASRLGVESSTRQPGEAIAFGYFRGGEVVNRKYRALDDKRFWMDQGGQVIPWNFDVLLDETLRNEPLVITEGETDALSVIQCGFPRAISVPNGAPSREQGSDDGQHYAWVETVTKLCPRDDVVLAVDNDDPGARLRRDLEIRFGAARCRWIRYPSDCKDMNEVLEAHGQSKLVELVRGAPWCRQKGLYTLDDLPPEPFRPVYPIGFDGLDRHYRIRRGEFTVLSGIPNCGKSEFTADLACRMADTHGWRIAIGSFEENARSNLIPKLERWFLGKPVKIASEAEVQRAEQWVRDHFVFMVPDPDEHEADLLWLIDCMKAAVVRHGVRLIIVDPWNELEHDKRPDISMTEYVGEAIRTLKVFAKNYDVHMIVVAHPTKAVKESENVMSLYDVAESAHWANKPDVGVIIHRNLQEDLTAVYVRKVRFQQDIGKPGHCWFKFNSHTGRFEGAPEPDELKLRKGQRRLV